MNSFSEYLTEATGKGLTIFDIDETLFHTKALISVMKNGKEVRKLDNQQFNTYKLKDGESFDFHQFKDAKLFMKTSAPIGRMIGKAKAILSNATRAGSKMIMVTARSSFDNKDIFLDTFRAHGIDIDKSYVERAGDLNLGSPAKNKRFVFHKYLKSGQYQRIRLFDDSKANLTSFLSLAKQYPGVSFEAYYVNKSGGTKRFRV